jgi:Protein of unknown function (DUF3892)
MSTYEITGVRVQMTTRDPHEHITEVQINDSPTAILSRRTVVNDLNSPSGDRYYTNGGGERANVFVRRCPKCSADDYITTTPDGTKENNLLKLKRI